jgi:hypothetical protein
MYVLPSDGIDRHYDTDGSIARSIASFQQWLSGQTAGRTLRFDTYQGNPDITFYRLRRDDATIAASGNLVRDQVEAELLAAGFNDAKKIYAVYYDGSSTYSCGGGPYPPTLVGSAAVLYLRGTPPGARGCDTNPFTSSVGSPGYREYSMIHEIMHALGFVASCAPDQVLSGHVGTSPQDLMYAGPLPWQPSILDVNRKNYFQTGSTTCLDLDNSVFLTGMGMAGRSDPPPSWPLSLLIAQSCASEPQLKSISNGLPATIQFVNGTGTPVQILWLDSTGVRRPYQSLAPGAGYSQDTLGGHYWVAADSNGLCLSIFQAQPGFQRAVTGGAPAMLPVLSIGSTHTGSFLQGQPIALYTISVHNGVSLAGVSTVSVADTLPAGLTATAIGGPGWACTLETFSCSRSDPLPAGASYPPITVTVSVASNAVSPVTNQVSVSGGGAATATASDPTTILAAFTDVSSSDSFLPAIDLLKEYAITSACQTLPLKYCPNDNITEAQMAVFVVRSVMGNDNFTYTPAPYFSDVPASNLYFPWIQKMQDLGIALPCTPNQYCPDTPVTRGIMAVLIIRGRYGVATPYSYPATPYFTDVGPSHPYFQWIQKMKQFGITSGCTATTYCPDDPVTRGQMAVFIMRGEFNLLLPANTPVVAWASPASASPGQTALVTIVGQNTNFSGGVTQVNAGAGITVGNISVTSGTTLTAQFALAPGVTTGPRSIAVTTGSEEATLPNGFHVQ